MVDGGTTSRPAGRRNWIIVAGVVVAVAVVVVIAVIGGAAPHAVGAGPVGASGSHGTLLIVVFALSVAMAPATPVPPDAVPVAPKPTA